MATYDWVQNIKIKRSGDSFIFNWVVVLAIACGGLAGCSRFPAAPQLPKVSAKGVSAKALSLYDTNEDGKIEAEEGMKSPALRATWRLIDKDEDGFITSEEVAEHIRSWQKSPSFIVDAMSTFYMNGKPLVGATITLEPADFLGTSYPTVSALTNAKGKAHFSLEDPRYPGIYAGIYKVVISKRQDGKELIPAKYNSETELGCEFSNENWIACLRGFYLQTEQEKL